MHRLRLLGPRAVGSDPALPDCVHPAACVTTASPPGFPIPTGRAGVGMSCRSVSLTGVVYSVPIWHRLSTVWSRSLQLARLQTSKSLHPARCSDRYRARSCSRSRSEDMARIRYSEAEGTFYAEPRPCEGRAAALKKVDVASAAIAAWARLRQRSPIHWSRAAAHEERGAMQADALWLPLFPTTTIGSFPQASEVRRARSPPKPRGR